MNAENFGNGKEKLSTKSLEGEEKLNVFIEEFKKRIHIEQEIAELEKTRDNDTTAKTKLIKKINHAIENREDHISLSELRNIQKKIGEKVPWSTQVVFKISEKDLIHLSQGFKNKKKIKGASHLSALCWINVLEHHKTGFIKTIEQTASPKKCWHYDIIGRPKNITTECERIEAKKIDIFRDSDSPHYTMPNRIVQENFINYIKALI